MFNKIKITWFGNSLPNIYLQRKPQENIFKSYLMIWFLHPIKRRIAKYYLIILKKFFGLKVIAITGSSGKTTVKEMLKKILSFDGKVVASYKNIDPIFNIPSTILRCRPDSKYLILEMGVEYPGEMEFYRWLVTPDISIITNINPTHLEFLKSVKGVFEEKQKIIGTDNDGMVLFVNQENEVLRKNIGKKKIVMVWYGSGTKIFASDIAVRNFRHDFYLNLNEHRIKIHLSTYGLHFISNALVAAAVADSLSISVSKIKDGLEKYDLPEHRMSVFREKKGTIIIDDVYNNNPNAAKITFSSFIEMTKGLERGVVFGDMRELGNKSRFHHLEIGKLIAGSDVRFLVLVGKEVRAIYDLLKKSNKNLDIYIFENASETFEVVERFLGKGRALLLKGSRSLGMETIVKKIHSGNRTYFKTLPIK